MMLKLRRTILKLGSVCMLLLCVLAYSSHVSAYINTEPTYSNVEHIEAYDVDIDIQSDGRLIIVEKIDYDFAQLQRHGIRRWIPLRFKDASKTLDMDMTDIAVSIDGGSKVPFTQTLKDGIRELKIGNPDKTITGKHTYEIRYNIAGGMRYFNDHDELYWDVIGQNWEVPIVSAAAHIRYPNRVDTQLVEGECFTGVENTTQKECGVVVNGDQVDIKASRILQTAEGMTIVVGLPAGSVAKLLPKEYVPFFSTPFGKFLAILLLVVAGIAAVVWYVVYPAWIIIRWYRYGRDPDVGVDPTAYFDGPSVRAAHLSPAETGGLIDEKVDRRDLFGALIDLARRGYVNIEEREKKDFFLTNMSSTAKGKKLKDFEQELMSVFFEKGNEVRMKDIKDIAPKLAAIEQKIYARLMKYELFVKDPQKVRNFYVVVSGLSLITFNIPLVLVSALFGNAMPRKTLVGARAAQQARGLKNFLMSQERQLNFQGDKQLLFEKLLPFAVAFGIEKNWIDRFARLGIDIQQPRWYVGQGSFTSSFDSFNTAAYASSYAATASSYSSSGFSGGSSGGGGGGGGGGSW